MKNNGGPAFPSTHVHPFEDNHGNFREGFYGKEGMTLRDYFAGKAMAALFQADGFVFCAYERRAKEAYEMADAMLVEREK